MYGCNHNNWFVGRFISCQVGSPRFEPSGIRDNRPTTVGLQSPTGAPVGGLTTNSHRRYQQTGKHTGDFVDRREFEGRNRTKASPLRVAADDAGRGGES
jgi:hypothetical protein